MRNKARFNILVDIKTRCTEKKISKKKKISPCFKCAKILDDVQFDI